MHGEVSKAMISNVLHCFELMWVGFMKWWRSTLMLMRELCQFFRLFHMSQGCLCSISVAVDLEFPISGVLHLGLLGLAILRVHQFTVAWTFLPIQGWKIGWIETYSDGWYWCLLTWEGYRYEDRVQPLVVCQWFIWHYHVQFWYSCLQWEGYQWQG